MAYTPRFLLDEEDESSDRNMVRLLLPQALAANGSELNHWMMARFLLKVARQTLEIRALQQASLSPAELTEVEQALAEAHDRYVRHNGFALPELLGGWAHVQTQLRRIMPLVEQLLA